MGRPRVPQSRATGVGGDDRESAGLRAKRKRLTKRRHSEARTERLVALVVAAVEVAARARGGDRRRAALVRSIASVSSPNSLDLYDVELRAHHEHLRAAYGISPGDEVVDIGCGTGPTTREAARAAAPGRVVGVDVSERMLDRAHQVTAAERLDNVR
jgi:SAM-dependent methyltransferase